MRLRHTRSYVVALTAVALCAAAVAAASLTGSDGSDAGTAAQARSSTRSSIRPPATSRRPRLRRPPAPGRRVAVGSRGGRTAEGRRLRTLPHRRQEGRRPHALRRDARAGRVPHRPAEAVGREGDPLPEDPRRRGGRLRAALRHPASTARCQTRRTSARRAGTRHDCPCRRRRSPSSRCSARRAPGSER